MLMANVFAQTEALAFGKTLEQVKAEKARRTGWFAASRLRGQPATNTHPR
jgi:glucose-6-phosphate isomerase